MRISSNGGYRVSTGHLFLPGKEASNSGTGLHGVELLTKGSHGNCQITQAVAKTESGNLTSKDNTLKKTNSYQPGFTSYSKSGSKDLEAHQLT